MKLRLDKEDVLSLPKEKQDALRELWEPKKWDVILVIHTKLGYIMDIIDIGEDGLLYSLTGDIQYDKDEVLPLLTTGDIIEILHLKRIKFKIDNLFFDDGWEVVNLNTGISYRAKELIDCLLALALKEVLI